jgi:hypothetical protein
MRASDQAGKGAPVRRFFTNEDAAAVGFEHGRQRELSQFVSCDNSPACLIDVLGPWASTHTGNR